MLNPWINCGIKILSMLSRLTYLLIKAPTPDGVLRRPDTTGVSGKRKWIHADFATLSSLGAQISLNRVTKGKYGERYSHIFLLQIKKNSLHFLPSKK